MTRFVWGQKFQIAFAGLIGVVLLATLGRVEGKLALDAIVWLVGLFSGAQAISDVGTRGATSSVAHANGKRS